MEWTFPTSGPVKADIELAAGLVEVALDAGDEIRVHLVPQHGDNERARAQIEAAEVSMSGSTLTVHVPKRKLREAELHLTVSIPPGSSLRAGTASADVQVRGIAAELDVRTASGDLLVEDPCERLNVVTASGDVRCGSVAGDAEFRTASGDVSAESVGGEASVQTASGDIRFRRVGANARIRTASGDVRIGTATSGDVSVNTASGDVTLGVEKGVGAWLDLVTVSGDTKCTLPAEPQSEASAMLRISCRTVSGDILIRQSDAA
jgi:DUF4097 and DUF4098 domain-containing protein YvlB